MRCAVHGCDSCHKDMVKFHRFPTDSHFRKMWVEATGRSEFDPETSRICSLHFQECDHNPPTLRQQIFDHIPTRYRTLKNDAVPTLHLPQTGTTPTSFLPSSSVDSALLSRSPDPNIAEVDGGEEGESSTVIQISNPSSSKRY